MNARPLVLAVRVAALATAVLLLLGLLSGTKPPEASAQGRPVVVFRIWNKADLIDLAAVHASRQPKRVQKYLRYFDLAAIPPADRPRKLKNLGYVVNSFSHADELAPILVVEGSEGALAFVDVSKLRERDDEKGLRRLLDALENLGNLGSGAAPFPEPYYHAVVVEEKEETHYKTATKTRREVYHVREPYTASGYNQYGQYVTYTAYRDVQRSRDVEYEDRVAYVKTVKKKSVAIGGHLNKATALGLTALTDTAFPIFCYGWFVTNALTEPRYHELLGVGDDEADYIRLAGVNEREADRRGAQVRGAVLFSEVAHHNRLLERTPTVLIYGKGTYQKSYDFKTSIDLQDVLKDLLIDQADAYEVIFNLPNGLLGFAVFDAKGKRLDKADGDVANNRRLKFRDTQVRTAYHCIGCHLPDKGWIDVDDEVRALASKSVTLLSDAVSKTDPRRGDRIRQKYLKVDYNSLLLGDQAVVEAAVEAATRLGDRRGLTCAETAKTTTDVVYEYLELPVTLAQLAAELGYPQEKVLLACQTAGLDSVFVVLRAGRRARRDQIEAGFARIAAVLYLEKIKK